jgi:hypothetical protein
VLLAGAVDKIKKDGRKDLGFLFLFNCFSFTSFPFFPYPLII